jgi:hypothetical protein
MYLLEACNKLAEEVSGKIFNISLLFFFMQYFQEID